MTFAKLDENIITSTVWAEDSDTVRLWVYLLATADSEGIVRVTIPALAMHNRLTTERVREILDKFASPDPDSRSTADEGRRIRIVREPQFEIHLVNYLDYRDKDCTAALRKRRQRERERLAGSPLHVTHVTRDVTVSRVTVTPVTHGEGEGEGEGKRAKTGGADAPECSFEDFHSQYPRHDARQDAERAWAKLTQAERLECLEKTPAWVKRKAGTERRHLPMPATFLNKKRWRDPVEDPTEKVASPGARGDHWCGACGTQQRKPGNPYCQHCLDAMAAHVCPKCGGENPCGLSECQRCFEREHPDADPAQVAEVFAPLAVPS